MTFEQLRRNARQLAEFLRLAAERAEPEQRRALRIAEGLARSVEDELEHISDPRERRRPAA